MTRITIIGLGGIGSHLADDVARLLVARGDDATLTVVDGKHYEARKRTRQAFAEAGNKAAAKQRELRTAFPTLRVEAMAEFLSPENAAFVILPSEIVLVCVDNHRTRKLVADVAATVEDCTVIAGGNDSGTYGTVLVHLRRNGADVNPPITVDHPEIANPADRAPWEMSCEELAAAGETQVLATNVAVASAMLNTCWALLDDPAGFVARVGPQDEGAIVDLGYDEIHLDIIGNRMRSCRRGVATGARVAA